MTLAIPKPVHAILMPKIKLTFEIMAAQDSSTEVSSNLEGKSRRPDDASISRCYPISRPQRISAVSTVQDQGIIRHLGSETRASRNRVYPAGYALRPAARANEGFLTIQLTVKFL